MVAATRIVVVVVVVVCVVVVVVVAATDWKRQQPGTQLIGRAYKWLVAHTFCGAIGFRTLVKSVPGCT